MWFGLFTLQESQFRELIENFSRHVYNTALYERESFMVQTAEKKKPYSFEMRCYRRMLEAKRTDKLHNF